MGRKEYEIGYGKPPKASQFKPGQSGNPKGRRKGAKGLKSDLRSELAQRVSITENGRAEKLTKQQVVVKQLVAKAAKGDMRAIGLLASLVGQIFGYEDEAKKGAGSLSLEDEQVLAAALGRHTLTVGPAGEPDET